MTRAERRRIEREARKVVRKGNVTQSDVAAMMKEEEKRQEISNAVRARMLAKKIDRELGQKYYEQVYTEAYKEGISSFDMDSQSIFCISFALALRDKFPQWGADAIEKIVQSAIDWNGRFISEFDRDLDAYKLHYGVAIGREFELEEV